MSESKSIPEGSDSGGIHDRIAAGVVTWDDMHEVLIEGEHPAEVGKALLGCRIMVAGELMPVTDVSVADIERHDAWMYAKVVTAEAEIGLFDEAAAAVHAAMLPGEKLDPATLRERGVSEEHIRALEYMVATARDAT